MTRLAKVAIGTTMAVLGSLAVAAPANAAFIGSYSGTDVRIRSTPSTSSQYIYGLGYPGHQVLNICWTYGTTVGGNPYWDYHQNQTTWVTAGYSHEPLMSGPVYTLNRC